LLNPNLHQCLFILASGIQELSHVNVYILLYKARFIAVLTVNTKGVKSYNN